MGKIAFVFTGQGSQIPGMGLSFYQSSDFARTIFQIADKFRPGTITQCFEGTQQELNRTINTQPCLYTVELAAAAALTEVGIKADMTAGFSLGELSALTYAGAMGFEMGLRLVINRSDLMQKASEQKHTAMAAVLRLPNQEVESICSEFSNVYPVNYNCPDQITVSGSADEMVLFTSAVKARGGRIIPLKVSGGFHSSFMSAAAREFENTLRNIDFFEPNITVYSNYTGRPYGLDVKNALANQMDHPVLWETTVRNMIENGADTFIEIGPGKTLCGFIKKINKNMNIFSISEQKDLQALLREMKQC